MSEPFGQEGEVFSYSLFLVLANRILTFTVAATFLWVNTLTPRCSTTGFSENLYPSLHCCASSTRSGVPPVCSNPFSIQITQ